MQSHDGVQLCRFRHLLLNGVLVCGLLSLKGKFAGRGRRGGTSDMATIEDMENPEIWLTECQAKFGASGSKKIGMSDFQERTTQDFQLPHAPPVQNLCYWWQQAKCKHSSRANRATCSFSIAKAKAVCTCFNHHSHRPSLPASGSPWSLKFLKQRVQKESEKEIQ